jgi:succinyl-diaminopimelate desuccinylase
MPAVVEKTKLQLLKRIEADKTRLVQFLSSFLQQRCANPPGDTRPAVAFLAEYLRASGAPFRLIGAYDHMPNIVGSFAGRDAGRHLVLNGHIDVYPANDDSGWSGEVRDGRIYGRGAADMKCGTAAAVLAYTYLHEIKDKLRGKLTLTAVSDEQTGGVFGTRYLLEQLPDEVIGDCVLNGEPSGINNIRFMEKGPLRFRIAITAKGGHGGYPHLTPNPIKTAGQIIVALDRLHGLKPNMPANIERALHAPEAIAAYEQGMGRGAADVARSVVVNIGTIHGGLKVNQIAHECVMEAEIRIPIGLSPEQVLEHVRSLLLPYPEARLTVIEAMSLPGSVSDPEHEMVGIIQSNVEALKGFRPIPLCSLGGSDARFFRYRNIPAFLYGPSPISMGGTEEHVLIDEYLHVVKTHVLSAYDYLVAEGHR